MRTMNKATSIVIAAALTLSVTGCGAETTPPPPARATATASATPTPSVRPSTAPVLAKGRVAPTKDNPLGIDWAEQKPFTGDAADKLGAANVMTAYQTAVTFALQQGYTNLMARGGEAKLVEFSFVKPYLTVDAQKAWDDAVKTALANPKDENAYAVIHGLTIWKLNRENSPYKFRDGQVVYTLGAEFSAAKATLETIKGTTYLTLRFTVSRDIRLMDGDKAVLIPIGKDITYRMVPNGLKDHPWLIDSWSVLAVPVGKVVPDRLGATS